MTDCEIYLSKLSNESDLTAEVSSKLGADFSIGEIPAISDVCIKLYVSDEKIENTAVNGIIKTLKETSETMENVSVEIIEEEFLNLIKDNRITPDSKPRTLIHRDGDLHATVHIWLIKRKDMGIYVLLQKRSMNKDTHPGYIDVSVAGHVRQGREFRDTAAKELFEEIGISAAPEKLEYIGMKQSSINDDKIKDNEVSAVYIYRGDVDIDNLKLQKNEVEEVYVAEIDELIACMKNQPFKHCIEMEELEMLKKSVFR